MYSRQRSRGGRDLVSEFIQAKDNCLCELHTLTQVIASVQNQLTPERVNIMLLSKQFTEECHEREKWFGTLYSCEGVCGEGGEGEGEKGRGRADC